MAKKQNQADRDLESFLLGQGLAMGMVHDELFHELVEAQQIISRALSILGDLKGFAAKKNERYAFENGK